MKRELITLALMTYFTATAVSLGVTDDTDVVWHNFGTPTADSASRRSMNEFGVQLLFTDDESIFEEWNQPKFPQIKSVTSVTGTNVVWLLILYANPPTDTNRYCNLTFDLTITAPDGSCQESTNIPMRKGLFTAPKYNLQLCQTKVHFQRLTTTPPGEYLFSILVVDHVNNTRIPLSLVLSVTE